MKQQTLKCNLGTPADHAVVKELAYKFFLASPYAKFGIDDERVDQLTRDFLSGPRDAKLCVTLRDEGKPVGVLAAFSGQNTFNQYKVCGELIWWVEPDYRSYPNAKAMLDIYEYWGRNIVGAQIIQMVSLDDTLDKLYKRRGYARSEIAYCKELS